MSVPERVIFGSTGEVGRDGLLTLDQQMQLNQIQDRAAAICMQRLDTLQPGEKFPLVAMATGIGKGRIIHRVVERQMRNKPDSRVLIIAGTKLVLVDQTHQALSGYQKILNPEEEVTIASFIEEDQKITGYIEAEDEDELREETIEVDEEEFNNPLIYKTGKLGTDNTQVHVATIQLVQSEMAKGKLDPSLYDLVVVDEAHNIGTKKRVEVINKFKRVVGFTATPYRHSGALKDPQQYGFKVVESLTLPEAQELRLLPPLCGIQIDTKELVGEIPVTRSGTIKFKELEGLLKRSPDLRPHIADRIGKIISSDNNNYKTVVAVNFVWEAQELAGLLKEKGLKVGIAINKLAAKELHTEEIPAIDSIDRYKLPESDERSIQVLVSPYVASEGFDAPFTEVLVWASPTDSPLRYTQYTGRLARRAEGKAFGVIVDCLYQTSQYNWSYNFGMWMKGRVRQLDTGLLWLGPETDIERLGQLPQIKKLQEYTDTQPLDNLQRGEESVQLGDLMSIQENDFILGNVTTTFVGRENRLKSISDRIKAKYPDLIAQRRNNNNMVTVFVDKALFMTEILASGIRLKERDRQEVKEGDFVLSSDDIKAAFLGSHGIVTPIVRQVIEQIRTERPDLIKQRMRGGRTIEVITDRTMFINLMKQHGIKDKESLKIQTGDFIISTSSLDSTFVGDSSRLLEVAKEVQLEIQKERPDLIVERLNDPQLVTAIADRDLFIKLMLEKGLRLQTPDLQLLVSGDDLVVSESSLLTIFSGTGRKLRSSAKLVVDMMKQTSPELVAEKRARNGKQIVTIVRNKELFIKLMLEQGVKLTDPTLEEVQEGETVISSAFNFRGVFVGGEAKTQPIINSVIEQLMTTHPDIIIRRKAGSHRVIVTKDIKIFINAMVDAGAKLKVNN